ncbi:MAG: hypothetical protein IPJ81_02550 [Chitinophagaceae bacterium]|nr:hypothetical protein [Chitinophagaceae bacterium]
MDPYQPESLKISKGIFTLYFGIWMSAGSWEASNHSYSFRYQANEFALIGATSSFMHRATGEYTDCSYNFLTKKRECISGNIENDKPTTKPEWTKFYLKNLPTLKTFKKPYTLKVGNSIL